MRDYQAGVIKRIIYAAATVSGLTAILWAIFNFGEFSDMALWTQLVYAVTAIASVNWAPQVFTGDRRKDLLAYIGLK